ncbi:MAG: SAM-dependent methyltransferase [Candidatus Melainabacteria bacterium]|nr:MAG: SAM-dependent methyltransferase [Candidatus Melainabacteria bacterium]
MNGGYSMKTQEVAAYWEKNATAWTTMARQGFDVCRNHLNAPGFLNMLPDVNGLKGLDVGCGEGFNTRMVAARGAQMTGIDICQKFLDYAKETEKTETYGITFQHASAQALPFAQESFDFVMSTMAMMDMPDIPVAAGEVFRVLKPGGFFQFSICHPCFQTSLFEWTRDENGEPTGLICGDYFHEEMEKILEWTFSNAPEEMKNEFGNFVIPTYYKTLSGWLNMLLDIGFVLERFLEPCPDAQTLEKYPALKGAAKVALFLHIRCRKPF